MCIYHGKVFIKGVSHYKYFIGNASISYFSRQLGNIVILKRFSIYRSIYKYIYTYEMFKLLYLPKVSGKLLTLRYTNFLFTSGTMFRPTLLERCCGNTPIK